MKEKNATSIENVADVGCRNKKMESEVNSAGMRWYGFDKSPEKEGIERVNIEKEGLGRKFDAIMMLDVVEHLRNPGTGIENVANSIRSGGYLLITTPNPLWSRSRFHALAKGVPSCFTKSDLEKNGHVFTAWPHIMGKMINENEMEVKKYITLDGKSSIPRDPKSFWYLVRISFAAARIVLERIDKKSCGMSYGILCKKCE